VNDRSAEHGPVDRDWLEVRHRAMPSGFGGVERAVREPSALFGCVFHLCSG